MRRLFAVVSQGKREKMAHCGASTASALQLNILKERESHTVDHTHIGDIRENEREREKERETHTEDHRHVGDIREIDERFSSTCMMFMIQQTVCGYFCVCVC